MSLEIDLVPATRIDALETVQVLSWRPDKKALALMGYSKTMNTLATMYQVPVRRFFLSVIVAALPWTFGVATAEAQNVDLSTNNVDVDLSVIDQAGQ